MFRRLPEVYVSIIYFQGFDDNDDLDFSRELYYLEKNYPDLEMDRLKKLYPKNIIREKTKKLKLVKEIREKLGFDW